jgi:hypothetical protein
MLGGEMRKTLAKLAVAGFFLWATTIYGGVSVRAESCSDVWSWEMGMGEMGCWVDWIYYGSYVGPDYNVYDCYELVAYCGGGYSGSWGCCMP